MTPCPDRQDPIRVPGASLRSSECRTNAMSTRALRVIHPLRDFLSTEAASGVVLVLAIVCRARVGERANRRATKTSGRRRSRSDFTDHHLSLTLRRVGQRRPDGGLLLRRGPRDQARAGRGRAPRSRQGRAAGGRRARRDGGARAVYARVQRRWRRERRLGHPDGHRHRVRAGRARAARLAGSRPDSSSSCSRSPSSTTSAPSSSSPLFYSSSFEWEPALGAIGADPRDVRAAVARRS